VTRRSESLFALAHETGVLTSYHDWKGRLREARPEVLMQVLAMLGLDMERPDQADDALCLHRRAEWQTMVPPCAVAWDGSHVALGLRLPVAMRGSFVATVALESGVTRTQHGQLSDIEPVEIADVDGESYAMRPLSIRIGEFGYHRVVVEAGQRRGECLVIAAPTAGYRPGKDRRWGVFAPLYAMHRGGGSGAGDLADLLRLGRFARGLGGSFVGTLPLLASFLTEPFEPSPYSPVSRLFWNELHVDLGSAPGLELCAEASQMLQAKAFLAESERLRARELVDYRAEMAHRRAVLEPLAAAAWRSNGLRSKLEAYLQEQPRLDDYARFRAVTEARAKVWMEWPEPLRGGTLSDRDFDEEVRRYHIYAQYAMDTQLGGMGASATASLYLDLPVGVNRGGYDVWRDRGAFTLGASAGAPPDPLFSDGQNWGLPPLHPRHIRECGYRYFIDSIRHHMRHAGLLRVDHVMGLHRLFWIPEGVDTRDGVYVHYPAGEMYAILSLESHRHDCAVVGEDLGTVPDYVRPSMVHHGLSRLYVAQFSLPRGEAGSTNIEPPPAQSVASLNTHDLPTFQGYWQGRDIDDFRALGIIDDDEAASDHAAREATCKATLRCLIARGLLAPEQADDVEAVMRALLCYLAAGDAEMVLVNLEDLWLETAPHNVPGTLDERPNWRRKLRYSIDEITQDHDVIGFLRELDRIRGK
jgi:4-alpha-glucanotransferase